MLTNWNKKPKVFFALFIALLTYVFWPLKVAASGGWLKNWNRRQEIIVEDENINSDLSGFPVLIDLSTLSDSIFDYTKTNGEDLRMTTNDGVTEIPIEVVQVDRTANTGELWFYAASLSSTVNSEFYLYYDNPTANFYARDHVYGSENVWTNGYTGVYHFQEEPVNGAYSLIDSTANKNHLEAYGNMGAANLVDGKFSKAVKFDGVNDMFQDSYKYVTSSNPVSTVSVWLNREGGTNDDILSIARNNSSGNSIYLNGSNEIFSIRRQNSGTGTNHSNNSTIVANTSTWYYAASRFENTTYNLEILVDGIARAATTVATGNHGASMIRVGADAANASGGFPTSSTYFNGLLDEARVAESYRSVDWISAEYTNQNTPGSFYSNGTEEDNSYTIITDLAPEDNGTGIAATDNLEITFDRNVTLLSGNLDIYETGVGLHDQIEAGSAEITGGGTSTLTIEPNNGFILGRNYHVLIDNGFLEGPASEAFYGVDKADRWNFTTAANPGDHNTSDWKRKHKVTILASVVNGSHSNFPIYLNLFHLPDSFFANVRSDGRDIRMTEGDGTTEIPFELVALDTNNGTGELWFKAPSISDAADTDFFIWYDNNGEVYSYSDIDVNGPINVWTQGYVAVYHMNEDPTGTLFDSTANKLHSISTGGSMTTADLISGQLGNSINFDGNDHILIGDNSNLDFLSTDERNMSLWLRSTDTAGTMIAKMNDNFSYRGYDMGLAGSEFTTHMISSWSGNAFRMDGQTAPNTGNWAYAVYNYNGNEDTTGFQAFVDGEPSTTQVNIDTFTNGSTIDSNTTFAIGARVDDTGSLNTAYSGDIDEIHIADELRSNDWIDTEYQNQNNGRALYNIDNGAEDPFDNSFWSNAIKVIVPSTSVDGTMTDFPVYVNLDDFPDSFFSTVNGQGADIRVTQGDGISQVAFELVDIDTTANQGELWFKAPELNDSADSKFLIWFGNATARAYGEFGEFGATQVWTNGYAAVYHFNDDPTTGVLLDSTANSIDGSNDGVVNADDSVDGPVGKAFYFDGVNDSVALGTNSLLTNPSFTYSVWYEPYAFDQHNYIVSSARDCCGSYNGFSIRRVSGTRQLNHEVWNGTRATFTTSSLSSNLLDINQEYFLSFTLDASNGSYAYFTNDLLEGSGTTSGRIGQPASYQVKIGELSYSSENVYETNGIIDELKISYKSRPGGWTLAEYKNQKTPGNFYIIENGAVAGFNSAFWTNSHKITIPASEINGDVYDFPIYLNFRDLPASFFATVQSDGSDIRMTENDGLTQIPFELVDINTTDGEGELWFKADLSSSTDNDFYIWYGNASAPAYPDNHEFGQYEVWSENYVAVYHFNEDPTGSILDSTKNQFHGTSFGSMVSANLNEDGFLGKSISMDGDNDYINIGNSTLLTPDDLTISVWFVEEELDRRQNLISNARNCCSTYAGYDIYSHYSGTGARPRIHTWNGGTTWTIFDASGPLIQRTNDWYNLTTVVNSTSDTASFFFEGDLDSSMALTTTMEGPSTLDTVIGKMGFGSSFYNFNGSMSLLTISNEVRSEDWIKTEYKNQDSPGNFYMVDNADHAGFDPSRWSNNHKITILADQVNGDLTEFPVYVNLGHLPSSFHSTVDSAGADIRMTENDGLTQIPFEIVELNTGTENGELWFKATNLSSTTDTDFYIWYGNPTAVAYDRDDEFGSENVWTEGFVGVWHMNEDPTGTIFDSTKNSHHGTNNGSMTSTDLVNGQLGYALDFDGADDFIKIPDDDSFSFGDGTNDNELTLSAWFDKDSGTSGVIAKASSAGAGEWYLISHANAYARMADNSTGGYIGVQAGIIPGMSMYTSTYNGNGSSTGFTLYVDGSAAAYNPANSGSFTASENTAYNVTIGKRTNFFNGIIDEVRVVKDERSADWIEAEFINQNGAAQFYNIDNGIEDTFDPALWSNSLKITIPASEINADLSQFPTYLNFKDLPASFFGVVDKNGDDIRMTMANGVTQIAHELVEIDTNNGEGELWFKAPLLSSSSDNYFYIYYGNSNAPAQARDHEFGSEAVWSNGYLGVWHMNEDPTGTIFDSSSNNNDGNPAGSMDSNDLVSGQLGSAIELDGVDDLIRISDSTSLDSSNSKITVQTWFKNIVMPTSQPTRFAFLNKYDSAGSGRQFAFNIGQTGGFDQIIWNVQETGGAFDATTKIADPTSINSNQWYQVTATYNGADTMNIYTDSSLAISKTTGVPSHMDDTASDLLIGPTDETSFNNSVVDELRMLNVVRTKNWIDPEYENQFNPGNFYLVDNGNDAGFDASFWSDSEKITIPASEVNGDLTDFPVYINLKDLPSSFFSTVNGTGADIRITENDGMTQIPFELVSIDTNNGEGELWFKANTLSSSIDNEFFIWYGNTTAVAYDRDDEFGSENVWTNNFVAVYHMNEDPSSGLNDSTSNTNTGTSLGTMSVADVVEGKLGKSLDFDGVDDYIDLNNPLVPLNNFTVSFWSNIDITTRADIFSQYLNSGVAGRFTTYFLDPGNGYSSFIGAGSSLILRNGYNDDLNNWRNITIVDNGDSVKFFKEGILEDNGTLSQNIYQGRNTFIGFATGQSYTDGQIDEVRIHSVSRSDDWVRAEGSNQFEPGNFYLVDNGNDAGFDPSRWSNNHKITVLASQVNADLMNFPVYVDLSDIPSSFFSTVDAAGADIRMTENDGLTQVAFELVEMNIANGTGELWFKAPTLSSSTDTNFWLWYGNPTAVAYDRDDEFGSENVWTEGYISVWHMNEDPDTGSITDSTSNRYNATPFNMAGEDPVSGQLGNSLDFDGSNEHLRASDNNDFDKDAGEDMTFSAWVNWDALPTASNTDAIFVKRVSGSINKGYEVTINSSRLSRYQVDDGPTSLGAVTTITTPLNQWTYLNWVIDNENGSVGVNATLELVGINEAARGNSLANAVDFYIAHDARATSNIFNFDGGIDEARVSSVARSAKWISAEFINQNGAAQFYNIDNGIEDVFDPSLWSNSLKITVPASEVNADLTEFPVYLNFKDLPASFFTIVDANGADIRMTQGDALTQIAHELVEIDTVNGEGELWFKAPLLSSSVDNHFYIYYGNPITTAQARNATFGSEAVWSNGYVAVYHMNEDPSGTIYDSTLNHNNASSIGAMTSSNLVTGQLGKSIYFDGSDDHLTAPDDNSLDLGTSDFTISYWINHQNGSNTSQGIITKRDGTNKQLFVGTNNTAKVANLYLRSDGTPTSINSITQLDLNEWSQVVFIADRDDNGSVFVDGVLTNSADITGDAGDISNSSQLEIATGDATIGASSVKEFKGQLDEIRITNELRSTDWMFTEYANQKAPGNFYLIVNGDHAGFDDAFWSDSEKITILASELNGDLTDFPVYINFKDLPASFFGTVDANGADIRITENDGMTQVAFELVSLDTNNGEGELWFKANNLSSTVDNDFFIWYGNTTAVAYDPDDEFGKYSVWDDFIAVYHFSDDLVNGSASVINSAQDAFHGTPLGGMVSSDKVETIGGYAYDFEQDEAETIRLPEFGVSNFDNGTISFWFKQESTPAALTITMPFDLEGTGPGGHTISSEDTTGLRSQIHDGSANQNTINTNLVNNKWQYSSSHWSGTTGITSQRIDNTLTSNSARAYGVTNPQTDHYIASNRGTVRFFDGSMDEVRVSEKVFDTDWDLADYYNQLAPGNFYMINNGNDAGFEPSRWSNNHKITVLASEVNADLMNFPVYVDLSDIPASFFGIVDANGADIRMTENDGLTQVAFELVEMNIANGTGELWFKAPTLSSSTDTNFWLWYGNPTAVAYDRDDEFGSENVWTEGYKAVYHLQEEGNTTDNGYKDSTSFRNHGNGISMTTGSDVNGQLGKAQEFDGSSDYITVPDSNSLDASNSNITVSSWIYADNATNSDYIIDKKPSGSSGAYNTRLVSGVARSFIGGGGFSAQLDANNGITASTWHYISTAWDVALASEGNLYLDGNDENASLTGSISTISNASTNLLIGRFQGGPGLEWDGRIDEIHISDKTRSKDWTEAEYINQEDGSEFYNIDNGVEDIGEGWVSSDWLNRLQITVNASEVNGSHTNFPVYLDLSDLPSSFFATVQSDGRDIRMTNEDGQTRLPFELVSIDTTLERGELHFRAPLVTDTADKIFYIYYGNPSARMPNGASELGAQAVWSNGYVAVWHMNQNPAPNGAVVLDSTSYRNHGTPNGSMTAGDLVNGEMGLALDFDGTNDFIYVPDDLSMRTGSQLTFTSILNFDTLIDDNVIAGKYDFNAKREWAYFYENLSGELNLRTSTNGSATTDLVYSFSTATTWKYLSFSYNTGTVISFNDGIPTATTGSSANPINVDNGNFTIGASGSLTTNASHFDGKIDEIRVSNKARSNDWVYTEYNNQNSPNTFYTVEGTSEARTDTTGPKINRLIPRPKSIKTPRRHPLRMIFDQVVNKATGFINIYQENGNIFEAIDVSTGQVTGDGTDTLIITPLTYFTKAETYYVLIDPTAIRNGSNDYYEGMDNPETWKFTIQGGVKDQKPLHIFDSMI